MRKLNISSAAALVRYAVRNKLEPQHPPIGGLHNLGVQIIWLRRGAGEYPAPTTPVTPMPTSHEPSTHVEGGRSAVVHPRGGRCRVSPIRAAKSPLVYALYIDN
jgi:hypothetical protein